MPPSNRSREAGKESHITPPEKVVLSRDDIRRTLVRMAHEVVEKNPDRPIAVVGIHRRGAHLGRRLQQALVELGRADVPVGTVDINFYRDDLHQRSEAPEVRASDLPFELAEHTTILVDDVLYTGRTVRAAIDALFDWGRPDRVQLAVLVDRGHRELPFRPDYVGKNLPTSVHERVEVRLEDVDGTEEVAIVGSSRA